MDQRFHHTLPLRQPQQEIRTFYKKRGSQQPQVQHQRRKEFPSISRSGTEQGGYSKQSPRSEAPKKALSGHPRIQHPRRKEFPSISRSSTEQGGYFQALPTAERQGRSQRPTQGGTRKQPKTNISRPYITCKTCYCTCVQLSNPSTCLLSPHSGRN